MENLTKTIKKLSNADYEELLKAIGGTAKDKPHIVLETARTKNISDADMIKVLEVNPSTYYTLKSRLWDKIATALSKEVDKLKEKTARVPVHLYNTSKNVAIKDLENLEKELKEYDLSTELIVVYKTLARLNLYSPEYNNYQRLYDKHVAYSLAVTKAEDLLFNFNKNMNSFLLTRSSEDLEDLDHVCREMTNIYELYESHRLYVFNSIVKLYSWCNIPGKSEELKTKEVEVDMMLQEINKIFDSYYLDTFYMNAKPLVDFMYFEYYQRTGNQARAEQYYKKINPLVQDLSKKHILSFYMIQFLDSKVRKYISDKNLDKLCDLNEVLPDSLDIDKNEVYNFAVQKRFYAITKFYSGDFAGAAKIMNDLRGDISLRNYPAFEVECKLFQALQYCMLGDDELCLQIAVSITRQMDAEDKHYEPVKIFLKLLKAALKTTEFRAKIKKINELWDLFRSTEKGNHDWLWYVSLDEAMIRRMSNPLK